MRIVSRLGRPFNSLWLATAAANLGDGMALFVLPLLALAVGASPGGVAAVTAVLTLAWPVFGLHAGWLVDRLDRRMLLRSANLARAAVLAGVTLVHAWGELSLPVILGAAAVLGLAETLVDTALTSTVPLVVEPDGRTTANARIEATVNLTNQFVGPPLAGLLAGLALAGTTGASAVLYLAAAIAISAMVVHGRPTADAVIPPPTGLGAGFRFVWRQPTVRTLTLFTAAMNVVWAAATALLVVYAVGPGPLDLTAAEYGLMLTAMAAGGLVASVAVEPLRRRFGVTTLLVIDCVGTVLLVAPVALGANAWVVAAGMIAAGAGSSVWRILVATIRQNLSPSDQLGRVYAASRMISWGVIPAGAALAGLGAELWGVRAVFAVATGLAIAVLAGFVGFALRADLSATMAADQADAVSHPHG
ncbi:MAG TPA: MFS transporter [Jiangellaceae bacterium]